MILVDTGCCRTVGSELGKGYEGWIHGFGLSVVCCLMVLRLQGFLQAEIA